MNKNFYQKISLLTVALASLSIPLTAWSKDYNGPYKGSGAKLSQSKENLTSSIYRWNKIATDANALDHTPVAVGENRVYGEQSGPGKSSRALAIVHIAIFESLNAIKGHYKSYTDLKRVSSDTDVRASIAQSAHDTLTALYPSQAASFDNELSKDLNLISNTYQKSKGIALGKSAAFKILALREKDGAEQKDPLLGSEFITSNEPGKWRQDPISKYPWALGAYWGEVKPFLMKSAMQFRVPAPPALNSKEYATAFDEVLRLGGNGVNTATERTADQTIMGIFWAYGGTPTLGTPPRLYNQITVHIAKQKKTPAIELARLLALVNLAMAEEGIADWESKYYYQFWRPITGIREANISTGPTGLGDNNAATDGDPLFTPLGSPASNQLNTPNFTLPFPSYPSGHSGFGGALFQTLRNFYGTDKIAFTFVSDEFNGSTRDNEGNVRPRISRSFKSLSQAEKENGQSRIYLGIHWAFDNTAGISQGRKVANYVYKNAFTPLH